MGLNIEIKARYPDLDSAREKANEIRAKFDGSEQQTDTFFKVPKGRLKLRESSRFGSRLIPYLRPDTLEAKSSQYALLPADDPEALKNLLTGMFGTLLIVKKNRDVYFYENVRIHLDEVDGLGKFIEFEAVVAAEKNYDADRKKVDFLLSHFGITNDMLIAGAYADLLMK